MTRRILLVAHPRRSEAQHVAKDVVARLVAEGIEVALLPEEAEAVNVQTDNSVLEADPDDPARDCELVCVLGGDGTILRGAEMSRGTDAPLLGVNLGHVGFLAEAEREDLKATVERIVARDYTVEERMTLDVRVACDGEVVARSWALNEVSVEKAARERMLELVARDRRPPAVDVRLRRRCVMATPTGSTAYAFSAGGPVVWPDVEAMLVVPISAHALFARPLVIGPSSRLAVEILPQTRGGGRACGATATGWSSCPPARGSTCAAARRRSGWPGWRPPPFTDRLVAKFDLPVEGWRGAARRNGNAGWDLDGTTELGMGRIGRGPHRVVGTSETS